MPLSLMTDGDHSTMTEASGLLKSTSYFEIISLIVARDINYKYICRLHSPSLLEFKNVDSV